jgi:hypothetical protein
MSTEQTECDIHIDYEHSFYDGETWIKCNVTFQAPELQKITIHYEAESKESIRSQISKDIMDYMEDPEEWAKDYFLKGDDNQQKLRQLEKDVLEYQGRVKEYERYAEINKQWLQGKEQDLARLKARMEERANGH